MTTSTHDNTFHCFKTYDIRGQLSELTPALAYRIGLAFCQRFRPKKVAVGRDPRLSGPPLVKGLTLGLQAGGAEVTHLGLCGTEVVYFSCFSPKYEFDAGIMVTASHNPMDYNGMKMVGPNAVPCSGEDVRALEEMVKQIAPPSAEILDAALEVKEMDLSEDYLSHLCDMVKPESVGRWKVLCDSGNGAAGPWVEKLRTHYPQLTIELVNGEPDGSFPRGVPNPLLPENRNFTASEVVRSGADLGVAWDGDFDRCFLYDNEGNFVDSYYLIGPLAEYCLKQEPGAPVLYDPRLTWCTIESVKKLNGQPLLCRTGHVFLKQMMKETGAVYGGEMSGHHYFKEFGNCDSGMLPWLIILSVLKEKNISLQDLIEEAKRNFPISGEINRTVEDADRVLEKVRSEYQAEAIAASDIDGVSLEFEKWRFNLRKSNTEPLIRLNVESRGDEALVKEKTEELLGLIESI